MEQKPQSLDVIIVGAGIAGLTTGCYAQMNGLSTRIFELHTLPGGLCTSWKRKGYTFDYCIHWLVGSKPGTGLYDIWKEIGLIQGRKFIDHEIFSQVEHSDGRTVTLYVDPARLQSHLTELFPADSVPIAEMCRAIRTFSKFQMTEFSLHPKYWTKLLQSLPALALMRRLGVVSMKEYAGRFSDPALREVIASFFGMEDMPISAFLMTLGWMRSGNAGYPIGGSLPMAQAVAERYRSLGGAVSYGCRVEKILTDGDRACGVRLTDGTEHTARWIISAADAHATFKQMLEDRFPEPTYERYFAEKQIFPSLLQVSLGINRTLDIPQSVTWSLAEPLKVDSKPDGAPNIVDRMSIHHYGFDPTLAPEGRTAAVVRLDGTPEYWRDLAQGDRARYEREKGRILADVVSRLEERFPGIRDQIEVTDVSTPWTAERYTGNWDGCMEGWRMTAETFAALLKGKNLPVIVPGLSNFILAGQWTSPGGGLPPSAQSGRNAVRTICAKEGRRFRTTVPEVTGATRTIPA
ncbi:MAG TPA: NAD(P)/FAD-dependent oxidoreductase [Spirochaetia bacterium]|nr:NAD(P)/FAD-dependent oxidoreductase [Spirochaetia bacterium]